MTRFIQDESLPKPQTLTNQNIFHCIYNKEINIVWKAKDEGKANVWNVERYGILGIGAIKDITQKIYINVEADKEDDSDIEETYEKESCNPQSVMSKSEDEKTPKILLATITVIT